MNELFTEEEKRILKKGYTTETKKNLKILEGTILGEKLKVLKKEENMNKLFCAFSNKLEEFINENEYPHMQNNLKNFYVYYFLTISERQNIEKKMHKVMDIYSSSLIE